MRNLLIISSLIFFAARLQAQDIYANSQTNSTTALTCTSCGVSNPNNAVDASLTNFSTIGMRLSLITGAVEQTLRFPTAGVAGDTVILTLEIPYTPAALDPNTLVFNSFNGATSNGENRTTQFKAVAPTGGGKFQFVFMPSAAFDGVQINLRAGGVVNLLVGADSINVYSARILRTVTTVPSTPQPIAGCEGPTTFAGDTISALCLGFCGVENPNHIVTPDPTDFVTLRVSAAIASSASISGYFADTACSSDTVVIAIADNAGQLKLGSYDNIRIEALLGNTIVAGNDLNSFGNILMVGNIVYVTFVPNTPYNGIRVVNQSRLLDLDNVQQLRVYQFCLRRLAPPVPATGRTATICFNTSYTFSTIAPPGTVTRYYDADSAGTLLGQGPTFTTGNLTDTTTIYFESFDTTSLCVSVMRDSVVINVYPQVVPPNVQDTAFVCFNTATIVTPSPVGSIFNFYADPAGNTFLGTGQFYQTDTITANTVIYVENTYLGLCNGDSLVPLFIRLIPDAFVADIPDTLTYCLNSVVNLTINQPNPAIVYKWYDSNDSLLFVGNPYPNFLVDKDSTLFIETLFGQCTQSPNRKQLNIEAVDPTTFDVDVFSPVYVCDDDTAVAMATTTSTDPRLIFQWLNEAKNTVVFTGNPFLVRSPVDSATFFVTAKVGECASTDTAQYTVINLSTITDQAFDSTAQVCSGTSAVLTSNIKVPGAVYTWYNMAGTVVFVGDTFVTPILFNPVNYYFEISNVNCLNGTTRHPIYVTIIAFPPTANVDTNLVYACSGDRATAVATATPSPAIITWYDAPTGGMKLFTGDTFRFALTMDTTIVYAEASIDQCTSTSRSAVLAVRADNLTTVTSMNDTICEGSSAQLFASSQIVGGDFSWWNAPTGGTRLATGNPFNTPILNNTTTYYVQV
ncbi:MAG: hypothetical protein V4616_10800, partial [Bacteroidota bacterium]